MKSISLKCGSAFASLTIGSLLLSGCYTQLSTGARGEGAVHEPRRAPVDVENLVLRTDGPSYEIAEDEGYATIWAEFQNKGERVVALAGCPEPPAFVIELWDSTSWKEVSSEGFSCPALYSNHIVEVKPRESFEFGFHLEYPGWYRLRLVVGVQRDFPDATVYSNPFLVK